VITISRFFYQLFLKVYWTGAWGSSFFSVKSKKWIQGRNEIVAQLANFKKEPSSPTVWFHCASVGEFEQARPLLEAIKKKTPSTQIVLTFFSPSGYDLRKNYALADLVCYLPFDFNDEVKRFIDKIEPSYVVWIKYEFWLNTLAYLHKRNIKTFLVASRFLPTQHFFRCYGALFRNALNEFDVIFVQDETSKQLLTAINVASTVAGDPRFDRVLAISKQSYTNESIAHFTQSNKILIIGSGWYKDYLLLKEVIQKGKLGDTKVIIAPHNVNENELCSIEGLFKDECVRLSKYAQNTTATILLTDHSGELAFIYRYAHIAWIGGGFGASVHNVLEAAVYGLPTMFGPNHTKSLEAIDFVKLEIGFCIKTCDEVSEILAKLTNESYYQQTKERALNYVKNNAGATETILAQIDASNDNH
jgi:3-deoxy-D-manno-octulosonic-acid transferase